MSTLIKDYERFVKEAKEIAKIVSILIIYVVMHMVLTRPVIAITKGCCKG